MANLISLSRLLSVPCMLVAAELGSVRAWIALFAFALFSDAIDGPIARARGTASELGARIDSIADCTLYLTMPVVALLLFPWLRAAEGLTIVVITIEYIAPIAYGFIKFHRLTSYHTRAARVAGVAVCAAFVLLVATRVAWPLHLAAVMLMLSALEEIAITLALPVWRADVRSLRHVLREVRVPPTDGRSQAVRQHST